MQFAEVKKFILNKLKTELPQHLSYHSVEHVKDVYNSCKELAKHEGVKGEDLKLLLTAALFHDSGFLKGPKEHEKASCTIAKKHLPQLDGCFSKVVVRLQKTYLQPVPFFFRAQYAVHR